MNHLDMPRHRWKPLFIRRWRARKFRKFRPRLRLCRNFKWESLW